jgi:MFS family permease
LNTTPTPQRRAPFAIFRNRNFTLLWMAQLISVAGSALSALAASILVYRLTGSAFGVALLLVLAALPGMLAGLLAGVIVDRYDRRTIMIVADLVRAGLVVAIPLLMPFGVVWLYVLVLLIGVLAQFFDPAHASLLPEIASAEELAAANSLVAISGQGVWAIGFAAAGLIISLLSIEWAFYIDALTFLISAACLRNVRSPAAASTETQALRTILGDLREGVGHLLHTPALRSLYLSGVPVFLGIGLTNGLLLPFALRALRATELEYSLMEALCSVGFIASSLLLAGIAGRIAPRRWVLISYAGMGLVYVAFALSSAVPAAIALLTLWGVVNAPSVIGRQLVIQHSTPGPVRGRVNSAFFLLRDVLIALGTAAAGLADLADVRVVFLGATLLFGAAFVVLLAGTGRRYPQAEQRIAES